MTSQLWKSTGLSVLAILIFLAGIIVGDFLLVLLGIFLIVLLADMKVSRKDLTMGRCIQDYSSWPLDRHRLR